MGSYIRVLYINYNIPIYNEINMLIYSPFDGKLCIYLVATNK